MQKKIPKKHKGYILVMVIIMTLVLVSVTVAVTMLGRGHAGDIVNDVQKSKSYYIANAGLEMTYAALVESSPTVPSILSRGGVSGRGFDTPGNVINNQELGMVDGSGNTIGFANISVSIANMQVPSGSPGVTNTRWYYRIVSTGRINLVNNPNQAKDTHVLTMFIFVDDPTQGKIYDGDIPTP